MEMKLSTWSSMYSTWTNTNMLKQGKEREGGVPRGKGGGEGGEEEERKRRRKGGPGRRRRWQGGRQQSWAKGVRREKREQLEFLQKTLPRWAQSRGGHTRTVCTGAKAPEERSCARHGATAREKERRKEKGSKGRKERKGKRRDERKTTYRTRLWVLRKCMWHEFNVAHCPRVTKYPKQQHGNNLAIGDNQINSTANTLNT